MSIQVAAFQCDAVRGFGRQNRDIEAIRQLPVRSEVELAHRLLVPIEAALLEHAAEFQRGRQVPASRAVEHQRRVVAGPLAEISAEFRVLPPVAPGVELEGDKALIDALLDVALVLSHFVPGYGRGVSRDFRVVAPHQFVGGQVRFLRFEVPSEEINQAEMSHIGLLDSIDLPHFGPEALGQQRIVADKAFQPPPRQTRDRLTVRDLGRARDPFVGVHAEDGRLRPLVDRRAVSRSRQTFAPTERHGWVLALDHIAANVGDPHPRSPNRPYGYCMRYAVSVTWWRSIR